MAKQLSSKLTLIRTVSFPSLGVERGGKKVLLGIGGNIGNVVRRFGYLLSYLRRSMCLRILETSPILKNPPFGYTQQDDFYNALLLIETSLSPKDLLRYLLRVEKVFGRKRSFPDAPRTLDIDMIFYERVTMHTKFLTLPHHGWSDRASVLIPLSYMKRFV
ncbi:MAG: 2-amino-4-hydroxy-6-hydroxymethyldihydropteridine diphosphokinase [Sulfurovum sp.]|nr:2-amino-4-hydroxy-6-hydroxymethyldihydropteridine diphosphokinase [Sulfurovum sp.]